MSGTRPVSEIQITDHFPYEKIDQFPYEQTLGGFPPDFSHISVLFFVLYYMFCLPRKQKCLVWPSTTRTPWNWDSDLEVLKMHFPFALQGINQKECIRVSSMSVVPKLRARVVFEAGLPRNVQAGYPHLKLLNCTGRDSWNTPDTFLMLLARVGNCCICHKEVFAHTSELRREKSSLHGGKQVKRKRGLQENQLLRRLVSCKFYMLTLYMFATISGSFGMYIFYLRAVCNTGSISLIFDLECRKRETEFFHREGLFPKVN